MVEQIPFDIAEILDSINRKQFLDGDGSASLAP